MYPILVEVHRTHTEMRAPRLPTYMLGAGVLINVRVRFWIRG